MISARTAMNGGAAVGLAGAALLYRFSPQENSFYPRCPFYALTGHLCPGCGATRAVAELLHGHVAAALRLKTSMTLSSPVAPWYFSEIYLVAVGGGRVVRAQGFQQHPAQHPP